jgi:hypothetical protein
VIHYSGGMISAGSRPECSAESIGSDISTGVGEGKCREWAAEQGLRWCRRADVEDLRLVVTWGQGW